MQSIDLIETKAYVTKEIIKERNLNWLQIPDHPYRILITGGSGSRKTNLLLNLIDHQHGIDKLYLYAKNLSEGKDRKRKILIVFDDMMSYADLLSNKKINPIVTKPFIRERKLIICQKILD